MPYTLSTGHVPGQSMASADIDAIAAAINTTTAGVYNVREFGAVGDGATDDATAIQAAITACANAGGGEVRFPPGTYLVGTTLSIAASKVSLVGTGWDATTLKAKNGLNADLIALAGGLAFTMRVAHLTLDHNGGNQTAGGCFYGHGAVHSRFEWVHFTRGFDYGLWLHEIGTGNVAHHNRVTNCLFDGSNVGTGNGQGIRIQGSDENYVSCNDFENWGGATPGSEPYAIKDWSGTNLIVDNVFVGGHEAVRMQDISNSRLIGNVFDGVGRAGCHITGSGITVLGNLFSGGGQDSAGTYASLEIDGSGTNVVQANVFVSPGTASQLRSFIRQFSTSQVNDLIAANRFSVVGSLSVGKIELGGGVTYVRQNTGFATEASGTATVASGTTSIAVTHGLDRTPALANVSVTPTNNPTNTVKWWTGGATSTQFTINTSGDPGTSGLAFAWQAQVV